MIKIIKSKLTLKIIAAVLMLAVAAACFTVNAWFVDQRKTVSIDASSMTVQAATIGETLDVSMEVSTSPAFGIPGGSVDVTITLKDDGSDRAYAYEIKMPEDWNVEAQPKVLDTAKCEWIGIEKPGKTVRGIIKPKSAKSDDIKIMLKLTFIGKEVDYDGNDTQGDVINLDDIITVRYVQATPAAIKDVFDGITDKELKDLLTDAGIKMKGVD
jgi:hypothetical protein